MFRDNRDKETRVKDTLEKLTRYGGEDKEAIEFLQAKISGLKNQVEDKNRQLKERLVLTNPSELAETLRNFVSDWAEPLAELDTLRSDAKKVHEENNSLRGRISDLESENNHLQERVKQLMQQLVHQNTDHTVNPILSQGITPDYIHLEFKKILRSKLQDVVTKIHSELKFVNSSRRESDRIITSIISNGIIKYGWYLICTHEIDENTLQTKLKEHLEILFNDRFHTQVPDYHLVGLDSYINDVIVLLNAMVNFSNSMQILFPEENEAFDDTKQEYVKGSANSGPITFTVLPGLMIKDKIVVKPEVYIEPTR